MMPNLLVLGFSRGVVSVITCREKGDIMLDAEDTYTFTWDHF